MNTAERTPREIYPSQYARMEAQRILRDRYPDEYKEFLNKVPKGGNRTNHASTILARKYWIEFKIEYHRLLHEWEIK